MDQFVQSFFFAVCGDFGARLGDCRVNCSLWNIPALPDSSTATPMNSVLPVHLVMEGSRWAAFREHLCFALGRPQSTSEF